MKYKDMKYINYRCRKCNQTISEYIGDLNAYSKESKTNMKGVLINAKYQHPNCLIHPNEEVFCDLISISSEPIVSEDFIYNNKNEE